MKFALLPAFLGFGIQFLLKKHLKYFKLSCDDEKKSNLQA
jgi:hypothetical protein